MTTVATVLNRASRQMLGGVVEERNKLASSITAAATSVTLSYDIGGLRAGSVFEVDQELCYVWEATASTKTLVVERGYGGTTAASHAAAAPTVTSPRFPRALLFDSLNAELDDLSSTSNGLFKVTALDISYNGSDRQVNLTSATNVIDLIDVRLRLLADDFPVIRGVRLQRDLPTSDFASGISLVFDEWLRAGTLRVRYKTHFTRATGESDDLSTACGLPSTCDDLVEMGIILRATASRELKRNFTESQSDTRRAEEVPATAMRDSMANILRLRKERIRAEAARLKTQYPVKFRR